MLRLDLKIIRDRLDPSDASQIQFYDLGILYASEEQIHPWGLLLIHKTLSWLHMDPILALWIIFIDSGPLETFEAIQVFICSC